MPGIRLHIFKDEHVYNITLLRFLKAEFDLDHHQFIFLTKDSGKTDGIFPGHLFHLPGLKGLLNAIKLARKSDIVYFHSLPMGPTVILWALYSSIFKKAVWIYWGADVYAYRNRFKNIKHFVYHICRKIIIRKIPHIAGFLEGDYQIIRKYYKTRAKYHKVVYQLPTGFDLIDNHKFDIKRADSHALRILLGNSASKTNLHLEALELLQKFRNENIEIICPLSYGVKQHSYYDAVVKRGRELFGDRFIPLTEFMDPEKYIELLASVDIAIMNHNRQEALGNTISLLYMQKKVYLKPETSSFEYFNGLNVKVYNINDLLTENYKQFCTFDHFESNRNPQLLKKALSNANYKKWWEELINLS